MPSAPNTLGRATSYEELLALAESAGLGDDLVVQTPVRRLRQDHVLHRQRGRPRDRPAAGGRVALRGHRTATVVGAWSDRPHAFQVGSRWPLDGPTLTARILESAAPRGSRRLRGRSRHDRRRGPGDGDPRVRRRPDLRRREAGGRCRLDSTDRRRCPTTPRIGSSSSPSWSRRRSRTPPRRTSSRGSPTSRRRCGASRRSSRRACRPASCSPPSPRRSAAARRRRSPG